MKLELRDFQREAARQILVRLNAARLGYRSGGLRGAVGLTATTGAGKTVIATAVIEAILFGSEEFGVAPDPDAVFLWMTDLPELNLQTQEKMIQASSELRLDVLPIIEATFNEETLAPGRVNFLNTQKLAARADLVKAGPLMKRSFTFWGVIRNTIEETEGTLYMVVDEAHRGMTETKKIAEANSIIQRFIKGYPDGGMPAVPIVLGISATPARYFEVVKNTGRSVAQWDVPPSDVRDSGLIKQKTLAEYAGERQTDAMALFPDAVKAWWKSTQDWQAYHDAYSKNEEAVVVPALIVQVENEAGGRITQTDLAAVIKMITDIAGPLPDGAFAHAFGEGQPEPVGGRVIRYLEPSKIAGDTDARVIFFKTSLGTGWDCPRAEVLFSFRRAVDPTSIAQTIGRMVRSPLARRIEENEDLNAAHVFLPHYSETAVKTIVVALEQSGNEAVAETVQLRRERISLPLRSDLPVVADAITNLPSYLVPTSTQRQEIRVLADLANFLAGSGIDLDAFRNEMGACAKILARHRDSLAGDPGFQKEVDDQGEITIAQAELLMGDETLTSAGTKALPATEESIGRVYAIAERRLTGEVAKRYVRRRLTDDPSALGRAQLEAYALSSRASVLEELNRHASGRIDALRQAHGPGVDALSPREQARYKHILRQAASPSPATITLPAIADFARGKETLARHLYANAGGEATIRLNSWELDTIKEELPRPGVLGWLRIVDRADWALCIPRREGNAWRPFYPDFLVVRGIGERILVDIIDPHDHTKADAVSKAKGLSEYANRHAEQLGHVDLIAKVDSGPYRRLHLEKAEIRREVDALASNPELRNLYVRLG